MMLDWKKALLPVFVLALGLQACGGVLVGGAATSATLMHDRRSAGTIVDDQAIELKAYDSLYQQQHLFENAHINVTSYNNVVLLTGEVDTPTLREQVEQMVSGLNKVREVHNELVIAPASTLANRNADTWITTKVKSSLFSIQQIPDFDPTRVKVVTERAVVYLFGLLNPKEAAIVTDTVRQVQGVQKVVTLFEPA